MTFGLDIWLGVSFWPCLHQV